MKPIIAQLTEEFKKRGYRVQVFPTSGAPVLVAEMNRGMKKTLMFYNHYDVQPEEPLEEWKSPPYTLTIKNERLYGRGVKDNKGPLVANLFGIQAAFDAGYEPQCNIRFIVEGEEEAGSIHLEEFCKAHPNLLKSDGCVWEEASAVLNQRSEVYAGVKGEAEREALDALVSLFRIVPVDVEIAKAGGLYKRDYGKSHGVGLADAILAATAEAWKAELKTLNIKHYPMLKDLRSAYMK